jgi:hypothetical protein
MLQSNVETDSRLRERKEVIVIARKKAKMPQLEFNLEAIREIKKRRKRFYARHSKQSKPKRR